MSFYFLLKKKTSKENYNPIKINPAGNFDSKVYSFHANKN